MEVHHGAQSAIDRITGALQDQIDDDWGKGHLVTDWIAVVKVFDPEDGATSVSALRSDNIDLVTARGLACLAEEEIDRQFNEADDE